MQENKVTSISCVLSWEVEVQQGKQRAHFPSGNLLSFQLHLMSYGFSGEVTLATYPEVKEDELLPILSQPEPWWIRLKLEAAEGAPLLLEGVGLQARWREAIHTRVREHPILSRVYTLTFSDPPQVLWGNHYPNLVLTQASFEEFVKSQTVRGLRWRVEWPELKEKKPLWAVGLGNGQVSFYHFLWYYLQNLGGGLLWDYQKGELLFSEKKREGEELQLMPEEVAQLEYFTPSFARHSFRLQNTSLARVGQKQVSTKACFDGVIRDVLTSLPLASEEKRRLRQLEHRLPHPKPRLQCHLAQWPQKTLTPSQKLRIPLEVQNKTFRIFQVYLQGKKTGAQEEHRFHLQAPFQFSATVYLEALEDNLWQTPEIPLPPYPLKVEGWILSGVGQEQEITYEHKRDKESQSKVYRIQIPLWNQEVLLPFRADFTPSFMYFPLPKGTKVEVAFSCHYGEITRILDWQDKAVLPLKSQGYQILWEPEPKRRTWLRHTQEKDGPCLEIEQVAEDSLQRLSIAKGKLVLETEKAEQSLTQEERYSIAPQVAAKRGEVHLKSTQTMAKLTSEFGTLQGELNTQMAYTKSEVSGKLQQAREELQAKVSEGKSRAQKSSAQLQALSQEAKAKLERWKAELQKHRSSP